jgi:hypothetical protein
MLHNRVSGSNSRSVWPSKAEPPDVAGIQSRSMLPSPSRIGNASPVPENSFYSVHPSNSRASQRCATCHCP